MVKNNQKKKRIYYTGLIADTNDPFQPIPPYRGKGWYISLVKERCDPPKLRYGNEVVIYANSWIPAQRALNLILSSINLYSGYSDLFNIGLIAHNKGEPEFLESEYRKIVTEKYHSEQNIPIACSIAAKVSQRIKRVYALAKYKYSRSVYTVNPHEELDPFRSPHLLLSEFPSDHVMFSYAIISAYSAIEELGLEVRASDKKPSIINGNWNPEVKVNLEERLIKSGINHREPILWISRGPKRKIEKTKRIPVITKAPWAEGLIRDSEIAIIDAINYSSWLRSRVASHKSNDLTKRLSPFDVINVQNLVRRLLLESLGYWLYHQKKELN